MRFMQKKCKYLGEILMSYVKCVRFMLNVYILEVWKTRPVSSRAQKYLKLLYKKYSSVIFK